MPIITQTQTQIHSPVTIEEVNQAIRISLRNQARHYNYHIEGCECETEMAAIDAANALADIIDKKNKG